MSILSLDQLGRLGKRRWSAAVIAMLAARDGARFVELLNRLGIARESLVRTLEGAIDAGWIMRNPGHGHPLRPEYILTPDGRRIAPACQALIRTQADLHLPSTSLSRWSLPIVRTIGEGGNRFAMIERNLPFSNPRALTQSLKSLIGQELVNRTIIANFPPVPDYRLSSRGQMLAAALNAA